MTPPGGRPRACDFEGRLAELATAERFLVANATGPALITVNGEPGIGKSRFLATLRESLLRSGWRPASPPPRFSRVLSGQWLLRPAAGPPLLVLDDAHLLPAPAAASLADGLSRGDPDAVQMVLGHRPGRVAPPLAAAMTAALARIPALYLELAPFTLQQVLAFFGGSRPAAGIRSLYEAAQGNPQYMAIVFELASAGEALTTLRSEVDDLAEPHRTVARAGAILGETFDAADLPPVAQVPAEQVGAAIDELVRRDVLRVVHNGRLRFRHFLVRQAVQRAIGLWWQREAHARAARLFQARGDAAPRWAEHLRRSARPGDLTAARHLTRAAAATRWRSADLTTQWYAAAADLIPETVGTAARRGRLLLSQGQSLAATGQLAAAREAATRALDLIPVRGWRARRQALLLAARTQRSLGHFDEAAALLHRAAHGGSSVAVTAELALIHLMRGEFDAAADAARAPRDQSATAFAGQLALAHCAGGDRRTAAAFADRLGGIVDATGDRELAPLLETIAWLGWAEVLLGRYRQANRRLSRAAAVARETGQKHALTNLLIGQGGALLRLGRLHEALECYQEAHTLAVASGSDHLTMTALTTLCELHSWLGETLAALEHGARADALARTASGWCAALATAAYAHARLESGDTSGCVEAILAACGGPELPAIDPGSRPRWYETLTRAAIAEGDVEDACGWAKRASAAAGGEGYGALAAAHMALVEGRSDAARGDALDAARRFEAAGDRIDAMRARLVAGTATNASDLLHRVVRDATECSATTLAARARQALARSGRPSVTTLTPTSLARLTRRERQVAELVAAGHTNRQIGGELFLSVKTVERHLARIFDKLDITARAKLAAMVASDPA
ncbi:helix-turn-helix transcriptional regulator [Phytohabitans aurantiacus]|uniref:Transcriptional regulator n=1 Tax=Phytohabitans aurantiacus TaxID=3016789 RepID=A0ABQ5QPR2_9ACTN|nr:LuxR family transcriptional regulator [Phytohabitans aurantiacus]GLH95295.1 transcriptional regulator [Phytohabitans aurantiacus]